MRHPNVSHQRRKFKVYSRARGWPSLRDPEAKSLLFLTDSGEMATSNNIIVVRKRQLLENDNIPSSYRCRVGL